MENASAAHRNHHSTVTRRNFVRGASALTAAAGAGLALGTGAQAAPAAAESAADQPSQPDWLGSAPDIAETDIATVEQTEVLVVGAGVIGLTCAAFAAENGLAVKVVEKTDGPGTFRTDIAGIDTRLQLARDVHVDKAAVINEIQRYMSGAANGRLLKLWADESAPTVDWLLDLFDENGIAYYLEDDPGAPDMFYREWPVTHGFDDAIGAMDALIARVQDRGAQIDYLRPLVKLEREPGGRVTGAIVRNEADGTYGRIEASRGVVLATGGFANNDAMLRALAPQTLEQCVMREVTPSQDGDGIKAALWVGAEMDPDGMLQVFERGCVPFGPSYDGPSTDAQIWWPGSQPFLRTTLKGERFSNESTPYDFSLFAIRMLHDNTWVQLFDANWKEQIAQFKTVGCSRIVDPGTMDGWHPTMPMEAIEGMLGGYVAGGLIQTADTIEELAEKIGADPAVLCATVERYNELVEKGCDEDFYKEASRLAPLDTPPFYAARIGGMLLCTQSGLTTDADLRVLDTDQQPIEGLFAIGNDCGGTYARTYPSRVAGLTMGRNLTFARHVANYLAE